MSTYIPLWKRRYQLQKYLLRFLGAHIGEKNTFNSWLRIDGKLNNLVIGSFNVFNPGVYINCKSKVVIGDRNHFSVDSKLITSSLNLNDNSHYAYPIIIGDNNWFAASSIVCPKSATVEVANGITVGAFSLLNSHAHLPGSYLGIPAQIRS